MIAENMPVEEYRLTEGLNASALKQGDSTMLEMRYYLTAREDIPNSAMKWGTLAHLWLLEYEKRWELCAKYDGPTSGKGSTVQLNAFKAENDGKTIITAAEIANLEAMRDSALSKPYIAMLIDNAAKEVAIFWEGNFGKAKARLDLMGKNYILDVKTVGKTILSTSRFSSQFAKERFANHIVKSPVHGDIQLGWYRSGFMAHFSVKPRCGFIAIQNKPPYDCALYWMDEAWVDKGAEKAHEIAVLYKASELSNRFDGIQIEEEIIYEPDWNKDKEEDISCGELEASEL